MELRAGISDANMNEDDVIINSADENIEPVRKQSLEEISCTIEKPHQDAFEGNVEQDVVNSFLNSLDEQFKESIERTDALLETNFNQHLDSIASDKEPKDSEQRIQKEHIIEMDKNTADISALIQYPGTTNIQSDKDSEVTKLSGTENYIDSSTKSISVENLAISTPMKSDTDDLDLPNDIDNIKYKQIEPKIDCASEVAKSVFHQIS